MDLKLAREEAIEATNRFFWDKSGFVPGRMGNAERSADADQLGCSIAGRPAERDPRPRDPSMAHHHLDQVEELDRHEHPANCNISEKN